LVERTKIVACSISNERLVQSLGANLRPVRRLARPGLRVLLWLAIIGAVVLALVMVSDVGAMIRRILAAPDMCLAVLGSMLTAVLAAIAALQLCLPDRRVAWALLPLPAVLLWIGASGMGCLRPWSVPDAYPMPPGQTAHCLIFILCVSLPLSLVFIAMLRRGFSLRPNLTAIIGGLACASAAATLLNFIHPYDAAAADLAVHALAVAFVIFINAILGGRILISNLEPSLLEDKPHVVQEHRDRWSKHLLP
jgi:hypothetical protein